MSDRFDWFTDLVRRDVAPVRIGCADPAAFQARAGTLELGSTAFSMFEYTPIRSARPPSLIRRSDPEHYQLALIVAGSMAFAQRRNSVDLRTGDWVLFDTSHELESRTTDPEGVRHVMLRLPRATIPLPADRTDELLARPLTGGGGVGEVLRGYLLSCARHGGRIPPADRERLDTVTRDLAVTFLAHHLDRQRTLPDETRRTALLTRIDFFIDLNLGDPRLTPATIAARHQMSPRTLHALFEGRRTTVAATIRERRLERCRRDLRDPALASWRVADIAAHWGFTNPSVFSRTFRAAYGAAPGAYRRTELRAGARHELAERIVSGAC
ncbi:helix-turn-helix domain-containing protein [Streptomyces sp. NPDC058953]|uniref:AraC-like ligand-binding domain-containing protein n=1 Tax=unclassified Streptomyces TaxID=2593676 RepID=UPI0036C1A346